jgi:hypothetical protein
VRESKIFTVKKTKKVCSKIKKKTIRRIEHKNRACLYFFRVNKIFFELGKKIMKGFRKSTKIAKYIYKRLNSFQIRRQVFLIDSIKF